MNGQRKSGGQQAKEILGLFFEGLATARVPDKVQEGIMEEASRFLAPTPREACPKCQGELETIETPDGIVVQVCKARCAKK